MEFTIHPERPAIDIERARTWYEEELSLRLVDADAANAGLEAIGSSG